MRGYVCYECIRLNNSNQVFVYRLQALQVRLAIGRHIVFAEAQQEGLYAIATLLEHAGNGKTIASIIAGAAERYKQGVFRKMFAQPRDTLARCTFHKFGGTDT